MIYDSEVGNNFNYVNSNFHVSDQIFTERFSVEYDIKPESMLIVL